MAKRRKSNGNGKTGVAADNRRENTAKRSGTDLAIVIETGINIVITDGDMFNTIF